MERWMRSHTASLQQLPDQCREYGCSGNVAGEIVLLIAPVAPVREAMVRVGLPTDAIDDRIVPELRRQLPTALADWVVQNLWAC